MRSAISIILILFFMFLLASTSSAQLLSNTLRGTVRIANGAPYVVVRVQLQKSGVPLQVTFLRESRFEFVNIEGGQYTVVVDAPGYETVRQDVEVPGEWPLIDLRPQRNAAQAAGSVSISDLTIPKSARRQFAAAQSKLLEHDCMHAIDRLRKAIDIYAQYGDAHKAMGECYAQMNQLETAEEEFKRALEQPHTPELHLQLRKIYVRGGKEALGARQLELYAEEKPNRQTSADNHVAVKQEGTSQE